ncbi:hypothetical protein [Streptomyces melanogenes]|uniref:hypothetical protein n=1 Tax=Streptomyces melanogenes TaxID=67326 RepID=UPI00379BA32F
MLIRIARGATGFWGHGDDPLPGADVAAFRSACHAAARSIDGTASEVAPAGSMPSFHTAVISTSSGRSIVLCHAVFPVVAFVASLPNDGAPLPDFISPPGWAAAFEVGGFRLLDVDELCMPLASADTSELAGEELEQVGYWRPNTVGELMFNWWD